MTQLERARQLVQQSRRIAVLTGAGISAESGIPTFRGLTGMSETGRWEGWRFEELASAEGFARDPQLVWEWYDWRRSQVAEAQPNAGHFALVDLERRSALTLITQNVDGLHTRAGSNDVVHLHGDLWILRCLRCGKEVRDISPRLAHVPPVCECGGMQRPGVVWFGENLPEGVYERAVEAVNDAELLLVVGTSALVYPAAYLVPVAQRAGAKVIEINLEETGLSAGVDISLRGKSGAILPQLL